MKVAHILRRFVPEEWGGIESAAYHLALEMGAPLYCTDALSQAGPFEYEGVTGERFSAQMPYFPLSRERKRLLEKKGGNPISWPLFFQLMKSDAEGFHVHVTHRLGGMVRTAAKLKKIPYFVTLHGDHLTLPQEETDRMLEPTRGTLEWGKAVGFMMGARKVLDDATGIICVGKQEYDAMRVRYPEKKIAQIPNGVDTASFQTDGNLFRTTYNIRKPYVLCVSRLDPQKNQLRLIEAFKKTLPDQHLVLIGPPTIPEYAKKIRAALNDSITLIEGFNPNDPLLRSAYKGASLFALPSLSEPFGIVILEAWAAGVPVVASNVGGIPSFVEHGKTGILVSDDNWEEALTQTTPLLSQNALEEVQNYSWKAIAERTLDFYTNPL